MEWMHVENPSVSSRTTLFRASTFFPGGNVSVCTEWYFVTLISSVLKQIGATLEEKIEKLWYLPFAVHAQYPGSSVHVRLKIPPLLALSPLVIVNAASGGHIPSFRKLTDTEADSNLLLVECLAVALYTTNNVRHIIGHTSYDFKVLRIWWTPKHLRQLFCSLYWWQRASADQA